MQRQIVISEEEYIDVIMCLDGMDADLGSIANHSDDIEHVLKNVGYISKRLFELRKIFKE